MRQDFNLLWRTLLGFFTEFQLADIFLTEFYRVLLFQVTELNLIYRVFFGCRSEISEKKKKKPRLGVI